MVVVDDEVYRRLPAFIITTVDKFANCSSHGLRKAMAARLAEAGCTNKEIAAITGHTTDAQVNLYTKAANQKLLSDKAMQALQESEQGTNLLPRSRRLASQGSNLTAS